MKYTGIGFLLLFVMPVMADTNIFPLTVKSVYADPFVLYVRPRSSRPELPSPFTNIENRVGETIRGFLVKRFIAKEKIVTNRFGQVMNVDQSEIVFERYGREIPVVRGRPRSYAEQKVTFADGTNGQPLTVVAGAPFEFMGRQFKIEKVSPDARSCTVRDLSTGELLTTRSSEAVTTPRTAP
jgi:hypothetical protein